MHNWCCVCVCVFFFFFFFFYNLIALLFERFPLKSLSSFWSHARESDRRQPIAFNTFLERGASLQIIFSISPSNITPRTRLDLTCSQFGRTKKWRYNNTLFGDLSQLRNFWVNIAVSWVFTLNADLIRKLQIKTNQNKSKRITVITSPP